MKLWIFWRYDKPTEADHPAVYKGVLFSYCELFGAHVVWDMVTARQRCGPDHSRGGRYSRYLTRSISSEVFS